MITKSVDAFFTKNDKVAVVKGEWGVGKTYFWNSYIAGKIASREISQIAYSYISLFGKSNLNDIKQSIFQSAKTISANEAVDISFDKALEENSGIFNRLPWVRDSLTKARGKAPIIGWLTGLIKDTPYTNKFASLIANFEYAMVNNYVICIDDIERKGESLSIKEVMGLVDELAQRKNCKVVLIFNENSLPKENDKKEFETYREKVVDIELNYNPTHAENLACVFDDKMQYFDVLLHLTTEFDIKNIRILKKIKWVIDEFWPSIDNRDQRLKDQFLSHVVLFCWSYYRSRNSLDIGVIKEKLHGDSWLSYLSEKDKKESDEDKTYKEIATNLRLQGAAYDKHLLHLLEHGYTNISEFEVIIDEISREIEIDVAAEKLRAAWDIYSGSFADNLNDFKTAIKNILSENLDKIKLYDFASAIDVLSEFGEGVETYIQQYGDINKKLFESMDLSESISLGRIKNPDLIKRIEEVQISKKSLTIDEIAMKIVKGGWNPEDIEFLCALSEEDYFDWMVKCNNDLTSKLRGGLLLFTRLQTDNIQDKEKYKMISDKVITALKKIASLNEFNRKRVKYIYKVEV